MNKQIFVTLMTLVAAGSVSARSLRRSESFDLFFSPTQAVDPSCHTKTVMTYDFIDSTIELHEVVGGFCEIYIKPNHRVYQAGPGRSNGQGSVINGERILADGSKDFITVTDVRNAVVGDSDFEVSVTETFAQGGSITRYTLVSPKRLPGEISCFGQDNAKIVEVDSVVKSGQEFLEVQFSKSAGPMLPAFSPVGPAQTYKVQRVSTKGDATLIEASLVSNVIFVGGGQHLLKLNISGTKSNLTLSYRNVELPSKSYLDNYSVGCEIR